MRYVILLVACLSLAGCSSSSGGEPLSQAEAEAVSEAALQALAQDFATGGGTIRKMVADLAMDAPEFGSGDADITIEWGLQGTSAMQATIRASGFSFMVSMECGVDRQVISYAGERFEARPSDDCQDMFGDDESELGPGLDFTDLDGLTRLEVTPLDDGRVEAKYEEDGTTMTMLIDRKGQIVRIELDGDEAKGTIDIERGARRLISPAPADDKMPTSASASCSYGNGFCQTDATDGDDAPLSEFQVRIYRDYGGDAETLLATIPLKGGSSGGYTVAYADDGDGRFGEGDSFTVTGPDEDVEVVVWDTWADKDIEDIGIPGPGIALLALALVVLAVQRRAGKP